MNLLASADTLPSPGGMSAPLAFIYDLFNNTLFIFIGGLVLLGVFFWYLGSDQDKVKRNAGDVYKRQEGFYFHACGGRCQPESGRSWRSEEHTSELQSLREISYAVFCLKKIR